ELAHPIAPLEQALILRDAEPYLVVVPSSERHLNRELDELAGGQRIVLYPIVALPTRSDGDDGVAIGKKDLRTDGVDPGLGHERSGRRCDDAAGVSNLDRRERGSGRDLVPRDVAAHDGVDRVRAHRDDAEGPLLAEPRGVDDPRCSVLRGPRSGERREMAVDAAVAPLAAA